MAQAARGQSPDDGASRKAESVIPIEELEAKARAELECVGPRSPAQHAQDHQPERGLISLGKKHFCCPPSARDFTV